MFTDITVSAGRRYDAAGTGPRDIHILHDITGSITSGGYVSARVCMKKVGEALAAVPVRMTSIARASDVVTVAATAHGLAIGDIAVIRNVTPGGATAFNGEYYVATAPTADSFTFLQDGVNDAAATAGLVYGIPTLLYDGEGTNLKSAASTTGYHCRFANVNQDLWLQVNITDGTHTVRMQDTLAGTGSMHVGDGEIVVLGAIADAAVEGDTAGTVNAHLRGIDKEIGAVADAAVEGDAAGTVSAKLRGLQKRLAGGTPTGAAVTTCTGASQQVFAANAARKYLFIQNLGANALWVNVKGAAAVAGAGAVRLAQYDTLDFDSNYVPLAAVYAIGTVADTFTADEG